MAETTDAPSERIAKRLARAGLCSRRDAEKLIAERRVKVDGKIIDTPALRVGPGQLIVVDGKPVAAPEAARIWRYHKPRGLMCTHRDPEGRPTIFERLPAGLPRLISVGRLDFNSEGLMLLTNDGALARKLELPSNGWVRRYRVRAFGSVAPEALSRLDDGVTIEGVRYGAIHAAVDRSQGDNLWLTFALAEGKNREVRRVLDHLGLKVNRLIRVSYGPFQLGQLAPGEVAPVTGKVLAEQLGAGARPHAHHRR